MKKEINCTFMMSGTYSLESNSVYDAWLEAQGKLIPLPLQREYVGDSLEVSSLAECMTANGWDEEEVDDLSSMSKEELIQEIDRRCELGIAFKNEAYSTSRLKEFLLDYYGFPYTTPVPSQPQPEQPSPKRDVYAVLCSRNKAMDIKVFESMDDAKEYIKNDLQAEKNSLSKKGIEPDILSSDELLFTQVLSPDSSHYVYWKIVQTGLIPQVSSGITSPAPQPAANGRKDMSTDTKNHSSPLLPKDLRVETPMGAIIARPELLNHEVWIDLRRPDAIDDMPLAVVSPSVDESGVCDGRIKVEIMGDGRKGKKNKVIYFDRIDKFFRQTTSNPSHMYDTSELQLQTSLGCIVARPLISGIWVGLQRSGSTLRLPLACISFSAKNGKQTISIDVEREGRTSHTGECLIFDGIEDYFRLDEEEDSQCIPKRTETATPIASFIFDSHGRDSELNSRTGETVEVLCQLSKDKIDEEETGPMFQVRFKDGFETDVFADELTLTAWNAD